MTYIKWVGELDEDPKPLTAKQRYKARKISRQKASEKRAP